MSGDYDPLGCGQLKGEAAARPAKLDPSRFDIFGNPLSEEELRVRADPDFWFNDQEDNRRLVEEDMEMMAGLRNEEMWEAARRMEEAGRTTVTIKGRVFPAVTVADLERMQDQALENVRTGRVIGPGDEVWAVIRQAEFTGQETVVIDGREYPSATREDIERLCVMAREREQAAHDDSRRPG